MSGDLRAAVEGLPWWVRSDLRGENSRLGHVVRRGDVLALIPEGAVLVTEETLAAALGQFRHTREEGRYIPPLVGDPDTGYHYGTPRDFAAAILRHLREGT